MGIPTYVTLTYGAGFALAPLAVFVPPPYRVALRGSALCRLLLYAAILLVAAGAAMMAWGPWWEGMTLGGVALIAAMLMFWTAAEPRERPDDEPEDPSDGGGGGGSPDTPPAPPTGPAVDWADFDRQRESWDRVLEPV